MVVIKVKLKGTLLPFIRLSHLKLITVELNCIYRLGAEIVTGSVDGVQLGQNGSGAEVEGNSIYLLTSITPVLIN